jgi:23S rRNA-/tRNA-specific pseudouridylate synthase
MLFTNWSLYFRWKPAGLASVYGPEQSFLDALETWDEAVLISDPDVPPQVQQHLENMWYQQSDIHQVRQQLLDTHSRETERGLLNRLDTATHGFLYFAPDVELVEAYRDKQQTWDISKYYIAQVTGDCRRELRKPHAVVEKQEDESFVIQAPLMHHIQLNDRMVVVLDEKFKSKWRGKEQEAATVCEILAADWARSWLKVAIKKWTRHQIRAHLAAIGYPIVGDRVYGKNEGDLNLRSVGMIYT